MKERGWGWGVVKKRKRKTEKRGWEKGRTSPLHLPLDLDRPRFFQHAGSPALTLSLHRRTAPAPLRTRGPLTDGRKAEGKQGRLTGQMKERVDQSRGNKKTVSGKVFWIRRQLQVQIWFKMVYLTTVCILHDKAQAVMCLEGVFQSLQTENENAQSGTWRWCFQLIQEEAGI